MCTVLLPPGGKPTAVHKYIYLSILIIINLQQCTGYIHVLHTQRLNTFQHTCNNGCAENICTCIAGLIPQSLQLQAHVTLANMGWYHKCANSCARRSVCFCCHSGGGASIVLLTQHLISRDCGRRALRCVRLALKVRHVKRQGPCERNRAITHLVYLHTDGTLVLPDYMDKSVFIKIYWQNKKTFGSFEVFASV
jgi:hypothetical protein